MTLRNFDLLIQYVSLWCTEQPDITGFSFRLEETIGALIVTLEWDRGEKIYRISHGFSLTQINFALSQDYTGMVNVLAEKANQNRNNIIKG